MPKPPVYEYAAYKGEELLSIGTVSEIAEELGIKKQSVRFMSTPAYKRRAEEYEGEWIVVEKIGRIDEFDAE